MASVKHKASYVKSGKKLRTLMTIRKIFEVAGYSPMAISEYSGAIRAGRVPAGTLAFAVVDNRNKSPRFPGTVGMTPDGDIVVEGESDELWGVIRG